MHLPSNVAAVVYLAFVVWLFRRDFKQRPDVTWALWLPWSWLLISCSRFVSEWLDILGLHFGGGSLEEGSPVDAIYFFIAIIAGYWVLRQRRISLGEFVLRNRWVAVYLFFCLVACVWSDFPLVSFKRWTKLIGSPIMVLIVLTEPNPQEAIVRLFKRLAYIVIPISILFIKYFPELGRGFEAWTGEASNCGITTNKNTLGASCLIVGSVFFWQILSVWRWPKSKERWQELRFDVTFLLAILWLMHLARSSTSIACLFVVMLVMLILSFKFVIKERIQTYVVVVGAAILIGQFGFHISDYIIQALGRNTTLTGRTEIWDVLLKWDVNSLVGTGYESFWLGERREQLWALYPVLHLNSAHNGYLETYINLGIMGLIVTFLMVLATYLKACRDIIANQLFGYFRLGYLFAFLIYNWTEVGFRTHAAIFFTFFLVAIDYPNLRGKSDNETRLRQIKNNGENYEF